MLLVLVLVCLIRPGTTHTDDGVLPALFNLVEGMTGGDQGGGESFVGTVLNSLVPIGKTMLAQSMGQKSQSDSSQQPAPSVASMLLTTFLGGGSSLQAPDVPLGTPLGLPVAAPIGEPLGGPLGFRNVAPDNGGVIGRTSITPRVASRAPVTAPPGFRQLPNQSLAQVGAQSQSQSQSQSKSKSQMEAALEANANFVSSLNKIGKGLGIGSLEDVSLDPISKIVLNNIESLTPGHPVPFGGNFQYNFQIPDAKEKQATHPVIKNVFDDTDKTVGPWDPPSTYKFPEVKGVPFEDVLE
jgi:hypothetical protein